MRIYLIPFVLISLILSSRHGYSQVKYTLSGYVTDIRSGETLIGANVFLESNPGVGTSSNTYGFYSLTLPEGIHRIIWSYVGYQPFAAEIDLREDTNFNITLSEGVEMQEVVVTATGREEDDHVQSTSMGRVSLPVAQIKVLPALFGEVDVLKTIQLLPGVSSAGEGSAGFFVRGGGADHNLVLLDEAVVYNSGHLFGFFSVFNADAIKNTTLIKGGIPAMYGGRISSVLDIYMKEGNDRSFKAEGGIGLISSRLTVEGPIIPEKSSFLVSGRRTYGFDLAQPFIKNSSFAGTNYFFYDLNAKINYRFSQKDRLFLSGYFGRDVLNFEQRKRDLRFRLPYGNSTMTLRWNHVLDDKLFFNLSAIYNDYNFSAGFAQEDYDFSLSSGVRDIGMKFDLDYFPSPIHRLRTGFQATHHRLTPSSVSGQAGDAIIDAEADPRYGMEYAVYMQDEWKLTDWLRVNLGLRGSMFQHIGPYISTITGREYKSGEPIVTYSGLEPRLFINTALSPGSSIKAGITSATQYLHLVSNTSSTLPADAWVPSSELVRPQRGWQYAGGYFHTFGNGEIDASAEVYYKDMKDLIEYRESYVDNGSKVVENDFVFGTGEAYGLELLLRKNKGALNGWVGYTLSRTNRTFPDIEHGRTFPATFDRTHDLSIVANYDISPKLTAGIVFIYATGRTFTPLERLYIIDGNLQTDFGPRNSQRLEPYHRMDLSLTWRPGIYKKKDFNSHWSFSVYNVYNRRNTFFTYTDYDTDLEKGTAEAKAFKVSIFPILPSVTWNFSWK